MWIGYLKDAPDFLRRLAAANDLEPASFVATQFSQHDMRMLGDAAIGIACGLDDREYRKAEFELTGRELHDAHGFDAVGAQFVQTFRIVFAVPA